MLNGSGNLIAIVDICEIAAIILQQGTFTSNGLIFLDLPEPDPLVTCEDTCEAAIREALEGFELTGQIINVNAGGEPFNGGVEDVFVGVVNLGDDIAIATCNIGFINP